MKLAYFLPVVLLPTIWFFARMARWHLRKDRLLRELYTNHRDIWESLGKPTGWQWAPPGRILNTPFSMFRFRWEWLRSDPDWLERAPELRASFQELREGFREWNFRAIPAIIVAWVLFMVVASLLDQ